ncbi:hypothetical protein [Thermosyntropha sp.]|uniref:hypothetical protein n=1 Tax=Thermosyntropha sp. TaxID=2740820 RepID=UPI0025E12660|nr:hypothetical protein [Thermosyntropha sp.]MBO8158854.1 hypothetical protein [Thermosyntropha sp.]
MKQIKRIKLHPEEIRPGDMLIKDGRKYEISEAFTRSWCSYFRIWYCTPEGPRMIDGTYDHQTKFEIETERWIYADN